MLAKQSLYYVIWFNVYSKLIFCLQNVCVADEEKILCIVRDLLDTQSHGTRHTINLPASTSVKEMISVVAKQFGYADDTINISYQKQTGTTLHEVEILDLDNEKVKTVYF